MHKQFGNAPQAPSTRFLVMFHSEHGERLARIAIESLRAYGGPYSDCPVWAFVLEPERVDQALPGLEAVQRLPVDEAGVPYVFAQKVAACAQAEAMASEEIRSLVFLSLDCLIIQPPHLFDLAPKSGWSAAGAAFRPVHHRNIGSLAHEPANEYWAGIYQALGIADMPHTVESFADRQVLRPYFNTHCFSWDPTTGLARAWWEEFRRLASDQSFQARVCGDELHRIFLHQAVLSTLAVKLLGWDCIRLLPHEYNYPLNLLAEIPPERRAPSLNSLVNAVYEDRFPWGGIKIAEPLHSWLQEHLPGNAGP
jgi:hypothetical protein